MFLHRGFVFIRGFVPKINPRKNNLIIETFVGASVLAPPRRNLRFAWLQAADLRSALFLLREK